MEDTLKRLLAAEQRASEITRDAEQQAEDIVQAALEEARTQQERFDARLPQLRASHLDKAGERAQQTVKEIDRRFSERITHLREAAELHEDDALEAAFAYLLNPRGRKPL
jgi:vacuolar-type H+-ATPase subunit H